MDTTIPFSTNLATEPKCIVRAFLRYTARVIFDPARFFRDDFPHFSTSGILVFGLVNAWVAAAITFFVETLNSFLLMGILDHWMQNLLATEEGFTFFSPDSQSFLLAAGLLLLGPFLFLFRAVFGSISLFLFAKLLIGESRNESEQITVQSALRIESAAMVGRWFSVVPIFGGLLAFLVGTVLAVTGVRERYGVSTRRAVAVAVAPYFLLFLAVLFVGAIFLVIFSGLSLQNLLDMDSAV